MDELKMLIELVRDLPALAIWLLVAFYGYKVIIVGSIYGVIRFIVERLHSWATTPKERLERVDIQGVINGMVITSGNCHSELVAQLNRVRGKNLGIQSDYIHTQSVQWLRAAIDAKEAADQEHARNAAEPARAVGAVQ